MSTPAKKKFPVHLIPWIILGIDTVVVLGIVSGVLLTR
jgi:hypothetical protein